MDKYWEKKLKENFIGSRIEGAFDRSKRASLNEKYPGYRRDDEKPQNTLSKILRENEEFSQKQESLAEIRDYLHEQYGSSAVGNEELQGVLDELGDKGGDHILAKRIIEALLASNSGRTDRWYSQMMSGKFGPGEQVGLALAEIFADEKSLPLAREFLGLKQEPASKGQVLAKSNLQKSKPTNVNSERLEPRQPLNQNGRLPVSVLHQAELNEPYASNPFNLKTTDLKLQATLLERSPALAQQLILAAGREPRLFGL
ncbi:hypothetical protein [Roseibium sp. M-1]